MKLTAGFLLLTSLLAICQSDDSGEDSGDEEEERLFISPNVDERERRQEYRARNYQWPLRETDYVPNTPGWRKLMGTRFMQLEDMEDADDRFDGFYQIMPSAFLAPNYTEHGFALTRCPEDLLTTLQQAIHDGLPTAGTEGPDPVIPGPQDPLFIEREDLTNRVLQEMHSYVEEWAGMPLIAHQAYGFRLYQNQSKLYMHGDKLQTHVLSFILHIDSSDDAEPWPIFIEDFNGKTHEVVLTPGDVLFYESSKCFHGRPKPLNGSWYTSVFAHYYPRVGWADIDHEMESTYAIPPHWERNRETPRRSLRKLSMVQASFREPDCPDEWCATTNAIQWTGPAQAGILTTPTGTIPFLAGDEL